MRLRHHPLERCHSVSAAESGLESTVSSTAVFRAEFPSARKFYTTFADQNDLSQHYMMHNNSIWTILLVVLLVYCVFVGMCM